MSTFRNPVGPQPSRVYWRRRLIVALGLVAVIAIITLILVRPSSGATGAPGSSATPTPTSTAETEPTGSDGTGGDELVDCELSRVTLEPVTDATGYEPGVTPLLTFSLKSTMTSPCRIAAGTDVQEYRITSGDDLIWSSKHCQTDPVSMDAVLQPGVPQSPASIPWDRTRSSTDTCDQARPEVTAGGASYHLDVIVGELESSDSKQFLLY